MVDINAFRSRPDWMSGKAIKGMIKHPGNKNKPHYNTLMRVAEQMAGTTGLDDPASGPGGFVQGLLPTGKVRMNEWDAGLVNLLNHVGRGDFSVTAPVMPDMSKDVWRDRIRGTSIQEINRGNIPKEGSLNNFTYRLNRTDAEFSPEELLAYARAYWLNKRTGISGGIRPTKADSHLRGGGYNNNTFGDQYKPFLEGQHFDMSGFGSIFGDAEIRQGDAAEALREWDIDTDSLLASDPPYEGEPSTYSNNYSLQQYLRALDERIQEGQPVVAFDAGAASDLYADLGLTPQIINRFDTSGTKKKEVKIKPEMVATNIEGFDALDTLNRFEHSKFVPNSQQQRDLFDFTLSEPQNAFDYGWAVLKASQ